MVALGGETRFAIGTSLGCGSQLLQQFQGNDKSCQRDARAGDDEDQCVEFRFPFGFHRVEPPVGSIKPRVEFLPKRVHIASQRFD